jgi:HEAT repeat protein
MSDDLEPLTDPDPARRVDALDMLVDRAEAGNRDAIVALRGIVAGYRRFDLEIYARTLNRFWLLEGDEMLEEQLIVALADREYGGELWTAMVCGNLGFRSAEPLLIDLLDHPDSLTRQHVCRALAQLSSTRAIQPLARRLEDEAEHVRAAASVALADIGGEEALAHLWAAFQSHRFSRRGYPLAVAVGRFGPVAFERLAQAAFHEDAEMRFWAAQALGVTGDQRAVEILTRLATDDDGTTRTGAHVSTAAKKALKRLHRVQSSSN